MLDVEHEVAKLQEDIDTMKALEASGIDLKKCYYFCNEITFCLDSASEYSKVRKELKEAFDWDGKFVSKWVSTGTLCISYSDKNIRVRCDCPVDEPEAYILGDCKIVTEEAVVKTKTLVCNIPGTVAL